MAFVDNISSNWQSQEGQSGLSLPALVMTVFWAPVWSTSISCRNLQGNGGRMGGWHVPITNVHSGNSFSKCIHIHHLTLLQQVWSKVDRTHSSEEGQLTLRKLYRKHLFLLLLHCFSFPCAKAWHTLGGMKAAYLIPYCMISVQQKQPDPQWPLLCETAKKLREAPFLVL